MENNVFITETDPLLVKRGIYRSTAVLFVILTALCCFAFLISWQAFLFFEITVVFSCVITVRRKQYCYSLRFEGNRIFITNRTTGEQIVVFDITADDFVINQTKSEVKTDHCSLMIKKHMLTFGGVKECSALKEYISQNF